MDFKLNRFWLPTLMSLLEWLRVWFCSLFSPSLYHHHYYYFLFWIGLREKIFEKFLIRHGLHRHSPFINGPTATLKEAACLQHLSTQITKKCLIILSFHGVPHACWHASASKEEWHESGSPKLYYLMETSLSIPPLMKCD